MAKPARRADVVAAGVASAFGAGLFTGLAPAAALAGPWLLAALVAAAGLGCLAVLSTAERPLDTAPPLARRVAVGLGMAGRLAAAAAIAGTFGRYLVPARADFGAVLLVVVVTAVTVLVRRVPAPVVRAAAVVVLGSLALVVLACFAIEPVAAAVAVEPGGSVLGLVASAGLLTVCFLGVVEPPPGPRVVGVRLPAGTGDEEPAAGRLGTGAAAVRAWRWGVLAVLAVVLVACLAVAAAVLRQLGAPRLALSPVPLLDALAAADATALAPLVLAGVGVGTGFALLAVVRGVAGAVPGVPVPRVGVAAGAVVAVGAVTVEPTVALSAAAVLLLGDVALRLVAARSRQFG